MTKKLKDRVYYQWDEEKKLCYGYVRHGECKQCGKCCKAHIVYRVAGEISMQDRKNGGIELTNGIGLWSEITSADERTYFSTRLIDISKDEYCEAFKDGLCSKHDEKKIICTEWPFSPEDLKQFPDCGYSFEDAGEWTYKELGYDSQETDSKESVIVVPPPVKDVG